MFCLSGHRLHSGEMSCLRTCFFPGSSPSCPYQNFRTWVIWASIIGMGHPKRDLNILGGGLLWIAIVYVGNGVFG